MRSHQEGAFRSRSHQGSSSAITSHQEPSGAIRSHQEPSGAIRSNLKHSQALSSNLEQSLLTCAASTTGFFLRRRLEKLVPRRLGSVGVMGCSVGHSTYLALMRHSLRRKRYVVPATPRSTMGTMMMTTMPDEPPSASPPLSWPEALRRMGANGGDGGDGGAGGGLRGGGSNGGARGGDRGRGGDGGAGGGGDGGTDGGGAPGDGDGGGGRLGGGGRGGAEGAGDGADGDGGDVGEGEGGGGATAGPTTMAGASPKGKRASSAPIAEASRLRKLAPVTMPRRLSASTAAAPPADAPGRSQRLTCAHAPLTATSTSSGSIARAASVPSS